MKVGGNRNYGYGKSLVWAGKNALKDRYGRGHFATQAAHAARWSKFVEFAKCEGVRDARDLTRDTIRSYASSLAGSVEANALSVRYAQNLVSTVNVVLETMRGDRQLRISPARLLGQRIDVRETAPQALDRQRVAEQIARLDQRGHARVATIASLARELGLRFREASLLDARAAYRQAQESQRINVTRGTKGGRGKEVDRWVPVSPLALAALARATTLQGDQANLIPEGMNFREWRDHAYGVWGRSAEASHLAGFHDLRAAYACERYEALTGAPAPVVAGERRVERATDHAARAVISQEIGHGRIEVVAAYVGSAA
jgi:Integrase